MKPFVERLNLAQQQSFYAKTHSTPLFEVGWHQHSELELIYFKKGHGNAFISNHVGEFREGDIYFLGPNLPHSFQKANPDLYVCAVVVQFRQDFWGSDFFGLPECREVRDLFIRARHCLKLTGPDNKRLGEKIEALEQAEGLSRITELLQCIGLIHRHSHTEELVSVEPEILSIRHKERIDKVYAFTLENYFEPVTLEQVAEIASMSIPAFCNYFKRSTRKTYIEFLNEVRIEQACKLLIDSEKPIQEIGFTIGYNTLPNFNKQFFKLKKMSPSQYRKLYRINLATG